jgi:hypothetical protein
MSVKQEREQAIVGLRILAEALYGDLRALRVWDRSA